MEVNQDTMRTFPLADFLSQLLIQRCGGCFPPQKKPEAVPSLWLGSLLLSPAGDPAEVNVCSYRPSHTRPRQRGTCITAKYTPTQGPTRFAPFLARHPSPFSPDSAEPLPPTARCSEHQGKKSRFRVVHVSTSWQGEKSSPYLGVLSSYSLLYRHLS